MFANGPIPAFVHQLKGRGGTAEQIVPASIAGKDGVRYKDWLNGKLESFLSNYLGEQLNPFEVTTHLLPAKDQTDLMRKFYEAGTPEERAYRSRMELPGEEYSKQVDHYMGPAGKFIKGRNALKNTGITAIGAGAGALGGNWLYNKLRGKRRKSELKQFLSSAAGAGLGGIGAYLAGTESGQALVGDAVNKFRTSARELVAPGQEKVGQDIFSSAREMPVWKSLDPKTKSEILWTLLAGAGGAAAGAIYSPRHSPIRGAIMGGTAGLGAGAGLAASNRFMDAPVARKLEGTLYGQAPVVLGATGLGVAAGLRAGRTLADLVGAKGRKEKGDEDLAEVDVLSNPELRDRVLA
jgi:hypothetical protein